MKVHSPSALISVLLFGGATVWRILDFSGAHDLFFICAMLYLIPKGLYVAFTEEGKKEDEQNEQLSRRAYRALFGKAGPFMPYLPLFCIVLASFLFRWFALPVWVWYLMLGASLVLACWIGAVFRRQLQREKERWYAEHRNEKD